jgi:Gpi18-like mannosyltransferase
MENPPFKVKKIYLLIFIIAILIKFILMVFPGHYGDLFLHQLWGNFLINHPPTEIYSQTTCNLPPLWVFILWFFSNAHHLITGQHVSIISEALKLPAVLADIAISLIIFYFLIKKGVKEKLALMASLLFLINPFVIYNSSVWGQLDSTYTLFVLLSFIFLDRKKPFLASGLMALSFLTKLQGIIFLPLLFFLILKQFGIKKLCFSFLIFLVTIFAILVPFLINQVSPILIFQKTWLTSWNQDHFVSLNSFNFWWLPQLIFFNALYSDIFVPDLPLLSNTGSLWNFINLKFLGLLFFLLFYGLILLKNKKNIFLLASLAALNFFMTPTAIHERYIFPFFALFPIFLAQAWPKQKKYFWPYLILSLTCFLNLVFAIIVDSTVAVRIFIFQLSPFLSLVNISFFIYLFYDLLRNKNEKNIDHPSNL